MKPSKFRRTEVISVNTIAERNTLIKTIYTNLTKEPSVDFKIIQDQINRVRVFHRAGSGINILIKTYLVIIIPVIVDLCPLNDAYGVVTYKLEYTIKCLQTLIEKLQSMQGRKIMKGNDDGKTLEQLVGILS